MLGITVVGPLGATKATISSTQEIAMAPISGINVHLMLFRLVANILFLPFFPAVPLCFILFPFSIILSSPSSLFSLPYSTFYTSFLLSPSVFLFTPFFFLFSFLLYLSYSPSFLFSPSFSLFHALLPPISSSFLSSSFSLYTSSLLLSLSLFSLLQLPFSLSCFHIPSSANNFSWFILLTLCWQVYIFVFVFVIYHNCLPSSGCVWVPAVWGDGCCIWRNQHRQGTTGADPPHCLPAYGI